MIISCPNCDTAYNLSEGALSKDGRKIRCKRCSHVFWARLISQPNSSKPKIEIFYKESAPARTTKAVQPAPPSPSSTSTPATSAPSSAPASPSTPSAPASTTTEIPDSSKKRKTIAEYDKSQLRNTLGELFGNLNNKNSSDAAAAAPPPAAPHNERRGTVMGIPIVRRDEQPTKNNDFSERGEGHATSFGMPIVSPTQGFAPPKASKKTTGDDIPKTPVGTEKPKPSSTTHDAPEEDSGEPRRRQATLWMLSEDEASSEEIANIIKEVEGEKLSSQPLPTDFSHDEPHGSTQRLQSLASLDEDKNEKTNGIGLRASQVVPEPVIPEGLPPETSDSHRRSNTLFGLVAPISANNSDYKDDLETAEIDADIFDIEDFLNGPEADIETAEIDANFVSKAEHLDYDPQLNQKDKATARRLANFLNKTSFPFKDAASQSQKDEEGNAEDVDLPEGGISTLIGQPPNLERPVEETIEMPRSRSGEAPVVPPSDVHPQHPPKSRSTGPLPTFKLPETPSDLSQPYINLAEIDPDMGAAPMPEVPSSQSQRTGSAAKVARTQPLEPHKPAPSFDDAWVNPPGSAPALFDQTENTDIIPRELTSPEVRTPKFAVNLIIWIVTFVLVVIIGLLVAWLIVMKLL